MSTETPASAEPVTPVDSAPEVTTTEEPLGAPGLSALKSEREARAAADKRAAAAEARIKEFEDAQKTEAERQADALAQAQRENAELKAAKTRSEIAAAKGIPSEVLAGPASGSDEDLASYADALIAWKGDAQPHRLVVPNISNSPVSQSGDTDFVRQLFGRD